jgi:endonuclease/exonuclease/phosphatase family metal-dependent hydrolase
MMLVDNLDRPAAAYHLHIVQVNGRLTSSPFRKSTRAAAPTICLDDWHPPWATIASKPRSIVMRDGDFGQALLSRWPFARVTDVEKEPRRAIAARVRAPQVTVVATHLGLSINERYAPAQALEALVNARRHSSSATSTTGSG